MASLFEKTFDSFEEFSDKFQKYKEENYVMFKTKSSETVGRANQKAKNQIPSHFVYSRVEYVCTHYGQPRIRALGARSKTK